MAFDGTVVAAVTAELKEALTGGRIAKIIQPEADEIQLTIRTGQGQRILLMSANASLPLIYLTDKGKSAPPAAPTFCMVLRKHIGNGRIISVTQPGLERIIMIRVEHLSELGDYCEKTLILELMGKHSNIIFTDDSGTIIDSIKRVPFQISSVREVLPGRPYFITRAEGKQDPLSVLPSGFVEALCSTPLPAAKAVVKRFTGFSPFLAEELLHRAGLDSQLPASAFSKAELEALAKQFEALVNDINNRLFYPVIYYRGSKPVELSAFKSTIYESEELTHFTSVSTLLERYYSERNMAGNIRQRSADLRKLTDTALERCRKKYELQKKQEADTEGRDRYRLYGELLQAFGYGHNGGESSITVENYYDGTQLEIPLDPELTALENANRYFARYQKLKRTHEALISLLEETADDLRHLESIRDAIDRSVTEDDFAQIRAELSDYGYAKKRSAALSKKKAKATPLHFISEEGFDIYVGKNNYQNDLLTFQQAEGGDWWFHAKGVPGSHVIIRNRSAEPSDSTFEAAAALAAWYSSARESAKAEVDYTKKKNIKKPAGARPGFVIYHTNYSMTVTPAISPLLKECRD